MISIFHFEDYEIPDKVSLCAIRHEDSQNRMMRRVAIKHFPELWIEFLHWNNGHVLAGRNIQKTCRTLGRLFHEHKIQAPALKTLSYTDVLDLPESVSYEEVASKLGIAMPDVHHIEAKAEFSMKIFSGLRMSKLTAFIKPADFSFYEPHITSNFKKEGSPHVSKTSVTNLIKRPRDSRFEGTYVAFTGTLKEGDRKIERKEAMQIVRELKGSATDNIDSNVTHLVSGIQRGREKSAKVLEAEESGIVIITPNEFFQLIES